VTEHPLYPSGGGKTLHLSLLMRVPHVVTGEVGPVQSTVQIPDFLNEDGFVHFVFEQIKILEMHEVKEWFTLDDKHVYDPHPEMTECMKQLEHARARYSKLVHSAVQRTPEVTLYTDELSALPVEQQDQLLKMASGSLHGISAYASTT
jgi:hypothetical protein